VVGLLGGPLPGLLHAQLLVGLLVGWVVGLLGGPLPSLHSLLLVQVLGVVGVLLGVLGLLLGVLGLLVSPLPGPLPTYMKPLIGPYHLYHHKRILE